jgi:predicted transcriptional regulator
MFSILPGMMVPKFMLRGFRRPQEVITSGLGRLERKVMEALWRSGGEMSVREVHLSFEERIAYTTLMTTLDRLHKKGLLDRRKDGRAFLYVPRVSRADFKRGIREDIVEGLLGQDSEGVAPVLSCIVEKVSERDRALLDELERLVREKREELRQKD